MLSREKQIKIKRKNTGNKEELTYSRGNGYNAEGSNNQEVLPHDTINMESEEITQDVDAMIQSIGRQMRK